VIEGVQEFEELQEFRRGAGSQNPGVRRRELRCDLDAKR
jgi:hypothetical protein